MYVLFQFPVVDAKCVLIHRTKRIYTCQMSDRFSNISHVMPVVVAVVRWGERGRERGWERGWEGWDE